MAKDKEEVKKKEEEKPKKSKLKLIIIGVLILLLGGGGYFGYSKYKKDNEKEKEVEKEQKIILCPLKSFVVNLLDKKGIGKRYLKVTMELEVGKEEDKVKIEKNMPQLKDAILLLLSSQTLKEINTMEGKLELKQAILSRIKQVLGDGIVQRIYFTEFVVQ